jgi:hypothetical protein
MNKSSIRKSARQCRTVIASSIIAMGICAIPSLVHAQTATIYGSAGNFDVVNNTGEDACGFEMDLEGVSSNSFYTYMGTRYVQATIAPYTNGLVSGMRVTWKSPDCSTIRTTPHAPNTPFGGTCYSFADNGCEHFGVSVNTSKVTSRWLVKDPANPGAYIPRDPPMAVPVPYYYILPAVNGGAPQVVDVVEAPEPPEAPELYGNPTWMKVFVRQMPREVTLDELLTINPLVVPMDVAQLEFDWQLVQADPTAGTNAKRNRGRHQGGSTLDATTRSVVRRYETYAYTGVKDPITNEALCADILCKVAGANEVGEFVSAQMAAVNVQGDFITVAKAGTGGGNVDSTDKRITCGNKCVAPYAAGTATTLTAKANSGSTFIGWTGACTGTGTCTVTVNGSNTVTATFNTTVVAGGGGGGSGGGGGGGGTTTGGLQLKVSTSNPGVVTSNVGSINCGTACSATVASGTVVTLTATPPAGKTFAGWSGACTGTANVCVVTVNANSSVKASFNK